MKYRNKPVVIEATQWFKNGDHPIDNSFSCEQGMEGSESEGLVVRYLRLSDLSSDTLCKHCRKTFHVHGWIDTKEGGHIVCPGDWIITGVKGEYYPCKPDIFELTYEKAEDAPKNNVE